jgi:Cft2 family RNA processing exonuclease
MPQHPIYYPSPQTNIEKLQELLMLLNDYGFAHEDKLNDIEYLMSRIYADENRAVLIREGTIDEDDDEVNFSAPVYELYDMSEDKEQFVQDYRNAIAEIVWAESYRTDYDELVNQIIAMRDLDYYRANIRNY